MNPVNPVKRPCLQQNADTTTRDFSSDTTIKAFSFLDLPDLIQASNTCRLFHKLAGHKLIWKGLAPSFGLDEDRHWHNYSLVEATANGRLLQRVCRLFWNIYDAGQFPFQPTFQEGLWRNIVGSSNRLLGLREQFRCHIRPALQVMKDPVIARMIPHSATFLELLHAVNRLPGPSIFNQTCRALEARDYDAQLQSDALEAFYQLVHYSILPESLDFIWHFVAGENSDKARHLLLALVKHPRFKMPPDALHKAVQRGDGVPLACLNFLCERGAKPLPATEKSASTLDEGVRLRTHQIVDFIQLMIRSEATPTAATLRELFSQAHKIPPKDLVRATTLLLQAKVDLHPDSTILSAARILNNPELNQLLFPNGIPSYLLKQVSQETPQPRSVSTANTPYFENNSMLTVFSYLDPTDLARASSVNKQFHKLVKRSENLRQRPAMELS